MKRMFFLGVALTALCMLSVASDVPKSNNVKQYVYVLKVVPRLLEESAWTENDNKITGDHFRYLQKHLKDGKLILAGKTDGLDNKTFGLVIFEAESDEAAQKFFENDPVIKNQIMTAELFPYTVALLRK